jgi:hypothetical protein
MAKVTIQATDLISDSREDLNANFTELYDDKEDVANKSTDSTFADNSDTKYPSQKATKAYVDAIASPVGKSWNEYAVDAVGNYSLGIKEHTIFPETSDEDIRDVFGLSITFVTTAKTKSEAEDYFDFIGLPFKKKD